ncbi:glycine receptor subunit alpha-2-like [Glandiceps talaboti]
MRMGSPVMIQTGMWITDIFSVSEVSMDYGITMFLVQEWLDSRLMFNGSDDIDLRAGSDLMKSIWKPDSYFVNQRRGAVHDVIMQNSQMRVFKDGHIFYDLRLSLTLTCFMELQRFPIDKQVCNIIFESFGYTSKDVIFEWNTRGVTMDNILMADFIIGDPSMSEELQKYPFGVYSRLKSTFVLERKLIFYILEHYVPSTLLVILSWVSFWIGTQSTPARASIGITTVLTLTTLTSGTRVNLPKVAYVKAIDIWMFTCSFFVFAALLEFAIVMYLDKLCTGKHKKNTSLRHQEDQSTSLELKKRPLPVQNPHTREEIEILPPTDGDVKEGKLKNIALDIDKISRFLFPAIFVFFNIVYWLYFMEK